MSFGSSDSAQHLKVRAHTVVRRAMQVLRNWPRQQVQRRQMLSTTAHRPGGTVLIVSHASTQCGIHQYGLNIYAALASSSRYAIAYAECESRADLARAMQAFKPAIALYNYFPATMPWLDETTTREFSAVRMGVMHEVTQEDADAATGEMFDMHLCPDPTLVERNPLCARIPRIIPRYSGSARPPARARIGSFGFGIHDKGFVRLVETVQREFDEADIELRMPFNDIVDVAGKNYALETAKRCRAAVKKPGIRLSISHDFIPKEQILDFLAGNTLNAFFYDVNKHRGISSTIEQALAVDRPLAITRCGMFRHVSSISPSICIEDSTLRQIISNGTAPLARLREQWTEARFLERLEQLFDRATRTRSTAVSV